MYITICDDCQEDVNALVKCIHSHKNTHQLFIYKNSRSFLEAVHTKKPMDLVFLDVQLMDGDGWEIAKIIKKSYPKLFITMITVHGEYIFDCFDRVDRFAPKSVSCQRVMSFSIGILIALDIL